MTESQLTFFEAPKDPGGKPARVVLRRTFNAGSETVFDAWLIPYQAANWMFGTKDPGQEIVALESEPRPKGRFDFSVRRGAQQRRLAGSYQEIRRPERLICSIGEDPESALHCKLTLELEPEENRTRMTLSLEMDPLLADQAETIRQAWALRCKALAELLEKNRRQAPLFT